MARKRRSLQKFQRQAHGEDLARVEVEVARLSGRLVAVMGAAAFLAEVESKLVGEGENYLDPWQREAFLLGLVHQAEVGR